LALEGVGTGREAQEPEFALIVRDRGLGGANAREGHGDPGHRLAVWTGGGAVQVAALDLRQRRQGEDEQQQSEGKRAL
jgi:hypothetical protein